MKKVFAILALATAMTACNNETEKTEAPAGDTTKTETPATAVPDTASSMMKTVDSMANKVVDTLKKEGEKAIEKGKEAVKEAVKH